LLVSTHKARDENSLASETKFSNFGDATRKASYDMNCSCVYKEVYKEKKVEVEKIAKKFTGTGCGTIIWINSHFNIKSSRTLMGEFCSPLSWRYTLKMEKEKTFL